MEGRKLLTEKEYAQAVAVFERAIEKNPNNGILHVCAAQAILMHMQEKQSTDKEYLSRARSYLLQAQSQTPGDKRIPLLQQVYDTIAAAN